MSDTKMRLESEVRRALNGGLGNDRHRRILAAMVTINECSLETAEQALAEYIADERSQGYETPCDSNIDVNYYVTEAGRLVRQAKRATEAAAKRSFVWWPTEGKPTNVISCTFDGSRMQDGLPRARVLSVKQVAHIKWQRTMKAKERRENV